MKWVMRKKELSNGMKYLKFKPNTSNPKYMMNIIPMLLVKNPAPLNAKLITLPLDIVMYMPIHICNMFKNKGANTPNKKYVM